MSALPVEHPSSRRAPSSRAVTLLLVLVAVLLALSAGTASAHASLVETAPADSETLDAPPATVDITFNEPVDVAPGAVRVYDRRGERIDEGGAARLDSSPEVVRLELPDDLDDGTYVVTWRVTSEDGHPVRGAFTFSAGEETGVDDSIAAQLFDEGADRPLSLAATALRGLTYIATLLAAGGVIFLVWVAGEHASRRLSIIAIGAAAAGMLTTALGIPLQVALTAGDGLIAALRPDSILATAGSFFLLNSAVRLLALAALAVLLLRGGGAAVRAGAVAAAALATGSFLLSGHTVTTEPRWLVIGADAVHLAAGATWFGGLALLAVSLRERRGADDAVGGAQLVARFSRVATVAIAAVIIAGLTLSWVEVRALRALTSTAYGWTLVVKVVLVVLVAAIGAYNHRRLVPRIRDLAETEPTPAGESAPDAEPRPAWSRLRSTVRLEAIGIVAVLLVTGSLVYLQPAREAAGVTGDFETYATLGEEHELNLVVTPNRAGRNEIHLYVLESDTFRPVQQLGGAEVTLELTPPGEDVPLERTPTGAGPGHWLLAGEELAFPGTWEITVVLRLSEFEEQRTTIEVPVNP